MFLGQERDPTPSFFLKEFSELLTAGCGLPSKWKLTRYLIRMYYKVLSPCCFAILSFQLFTEGFVSACFTGKAVYL